MHIHANVRVSRFCSFRSKNTSGVVQFPPGSMSGSCSGLSPALQSLLAQVKKEGLVGQLLHELERDEQLEFEMVSPEPGFKSVPGAMTGGSKRRLTGEEIPDSKSMPTAKPDKKKVIGKPSKSSVELPPGVPDAMTWGRTLIEVGKYSKAGLSYAELSESSEPEKQSYCKWMISQQHRDNLSPMVRDLVQYLVLTSEEKESSGMCYPGCGAPRRFKE